MSGCSKIMRNTYFPSDDVLKTVISIYMSDECLPLPTMEEVLLCTDATTAEEVYSCSL